MERSRALGQGLLTVLVTTFVGAQTQNVTPTPASLAVGPSQPIVFDVIYSTSDTDNTLSGLGLRIHWDSTRLSFGSVTNTLPTDLIASGTPEPDTGDLDGDPSTDIRVGLAWASLNGNWPNVTLPARLFTASFTAAQAFNGPTDVRFSASSTAAGYVLAANSFVAQTCTPPATPVVASPATAASGASYEVTWAASLGAASYEVQESTNPSFTGPTAALVSGTGTSFSHAVTSPTTYYYRVRAVSQCGAQQYASPWSATVATAIAPRSHNPRRTVPCSVSITPQDRAHGPGSGSGTIEVTAASTCSWVTAANDTWIDLTAGINGGQGSGTVSYTVDPNPATTQRTGTITVQTRTFTVVQAGIPCTYSLTPPRGSHESSGGSGSITVTTQAGCAWTATTGMEWIHIAVPGSGTGSGSVSYTVDANPAINQRSGTITVQGQTFTVTQEGAAILQEVTVNLPGNVPLVLVRIHGGTPFMMGAPAGERGSSPWEMPQHQVTIAQDYYLGKYEVTQAQWQAVMGSNPANNYGVGADYPVYNVSWNDIQGTGGFIDKLNQAQSTTNFRLPTEAEWEYAARAGTTTRFSYGDVLECGDSCQGCAMHTQYMWWCGNAYSNTTTTGQRPVGQMLASRLALFDMHGNVWEWVQDWWHFFYTDAPMDGSAWLVPPGSNRVVRGGSWHDNADKCRSAQRDYINPAYSDGNIGFRLARECDGPSAPVLVSPAPGATVLAGNVTLGWSAVTGDPTITYTARNSLGVTLCSTTSTSCTANITSGPVTWLVQASNGCGSSNSNTSVLNISCRPPNRASTPNPATGATIPGGTVILGWARPTQGTDPLRYDVYLDGVKLPECTDLTVLQCATTVLDGTAMHLWKVIAKSECGDTTTIDTPPEWRFKACSAATAPEATAFTSAPSGPVEVKGVVQQQPYVGQKVTFSYSPTVPATSWMWTDYQKSPAVYFEVPHPEVYYSSPGDKKMYLRAANCAGTRSITQYVHVYEDMRPVEARFSISPAEPDSFDPVTFTFDTSDEVGNPNEFTIDFGDGTPPETTSNSTIQHAYGCAKLYRVSVTARRIKVGSTVASDPQTEDLQISGFPCSPSELMVIDFVRQVQGSNGIVERGDLSVFNPTGDSMLLDLTVREKISGQVTAGLHLPPLPPQGTLTLEDIVGQVGLDFSIATLWFKRAEDGADMLPLLTALTFLELPGGLRFGQSLPVVPIWPASDQYTTKWFTGLIHNGSTAERNHTGFVTKLTFVDPTLKDPSRTPWGSKKLKLTLYDNQTGQVLRGDSLNLDTFGGYRQDYINNFFHLPSTQDLKTVTVQVEVPAGVSVEVQALMYDNYGGNAVLLTPQVGP